MYPKQLNLIFPQATQKWTKFSFVFLLAVYTNFCNGQNNLQELETLITETRSFNSPKNFVSDEKGSSLSQLNQLEKEIQVHEKLISTLEAYKKPTITLDNTDGENTISNLTRLYNALLKDYYNKKLTNNESELSTSVYEIYLDDLEGDLEKQDLFNETTENENSNTVEFNIQEILELNIKEKERKVKAMSALSDKLKKDAWTKNKENAKKPIDELAKESANKTVSSVVVLVNSSISGLVRENKIFEPNYEIDNKNFEDIKGFMSWPLMEPTLEKRYNQKDNSINIAQNGIVISSAQPYVQCIAQGEVAKIFTAGNNKTIIIRHDKGYYTSYSNIEEIYVTLGQRLKRNQSLGKASNNTSGKNIIQLQIWKSNQNLNPSHWLKNKN